jgi:hypothetical protein
MAVTRLSDAVIPSVFQRYMLEDSTVKTSLFSSGIFRPDA